MSIRTDWDNLLDKYRSRIAELPTPLIAIFVMCENAHRNALDSADDEWWCRYYEGMREAYFHIFLFLFKEKV